MENQLVAHDDQLPMTVKEKNYFIVLILSLLIGAIDLKVLSYLDAVRSIVGIILLLPLCILIKYSLQNSLMANEARTKRAKIDILRQRIFFENNCPRKTKPETHAEWGKLVFLISCYNQIVKEKEKINGILVAYVKDAQGQTNFFCSIIEHDPGCSKAIASTLTNGDWNCYTYLT